MDTFKKKIRDIKVEKQIIEGFRGNQRITDVSTEIFEFKIFNANFKLKIGFTYSYLFYYQYIINNRKNKKKNRENS